MNLLYFTNFKLSFLTEEKISKSFTSLFNQSLSVNLILIDKLFKMLKS